jgi:hypothetical protein
MRSLRRPERRPRGLVELLGQARAVDNISQEQCVERRHGTVLKQTIITGP